MKFLITGVSLRSKGGEAMVLESYKKIKELSPENTFVLLSSNSEYDTFFLNKLSKSVKIDVEDIAPIYRSKNIYYKFVINHFISILDCASMFVNIIISNIYNLKIDYKSPLYKNIDACDCILQIAGISFSDDFGKVSAFGWFHQMLISKIMNKKYFCMPQSIGPSNDWFINFCAKMGLNSATYIMPRGRKSINYLDRINLIHNRIQFVPDIAFSFPNPEKKMDEEIYGRYNIDTSQKYVAIFFNTHLYNWGGDPIIRTLSNIIDNIIELFGCNVILIAHEVNDKKNIDDRFVNKLIWDQCKNKEKIFNIEDDLRANEIKSLIKICDFTLCSRFHAMISSLKVGVVPIVIGWAEKYYEIMELFNLENLVFNYSQCNLSDVEKKILYVQSHRDELKKQILIHLPQYEKASDIMKEIIKNQL